MFSSKNILRGSVLAFSVAALVGCSDDVNKVSGYLSKGPVSDATCSLHLASDNSVVAGPGTTADGAVDFGAVVQTGVMYVSCTGGSYIDEATGTKVDPAPTMRSAKFVNGTTHFVITPLTELAVRIAEANGGIADNAETANTMVAKRFGIAKVDIVSVEPTDLTKSTAGDDAAGWYGTVLAAMSLAAADTDGDGIMDRTVAFGSGINTLVGSLVDPTRNGTLVNDSVMDEALANLATVGGVSNNVDTEVVTSISEGMDADGSNSSSVMSFGSIAPTTGRAAGGTIITITGSGFQASESSASGGTIGGAAIESFSVTNDTTITGVAPAGTVGTQDLVISHPTTSDLTASGAFSYTENCATCELINDCPF